MKYSPEGFDRQNRITFANGNDRRDSYVYWLGNIETEINRTIGK
jgi:hypothetical protein